MCEPGAAGNGRQALEQGLQMIRGILEDHHGHGGDGGRLPAGQPEGTVPSPALDLSFLAPDGGHAGPQGRAPGVAAGAESRAAVTVCLHLSPEMVAELMGMVKHLLGGGAAAPGAGAAPAGAGPQAAAPPDPGAGGHGRCPGAGVAI